MYRKSLALLMTGILLFSVGCGEKKQVPDVNEETTQTEEIKQEAQENEESVEIELPEQEDTKIDYTTADGLILPSATRIAVVAKNTKSEYWQAMQRGMQKAIDDLNIQADLTEKDQITMTFEGPEENSDAETQINTIDAVLAENPQVLCLSAIDMASCGAQLEMADENGIPVIMFDSGVWMDELVYTVCKTDNVAAGAEAANHLAAKTGMFGEIMVVASSNSTESIQDRVTGFQDEIKEHYSSLSVLDVVYADDKEDTRSLQERIKEILETHPNVKGCFVTDEAMAKAVLDFLDDPQYQEIQFVGFDAGEGQQEAIREGKALGIVCQNPYGMGYATIISAARALLGLENDEVIDAGYQWIDSSNIDLEENQKYLYE